MKAYKNISGKSGIASYEEGEDHIIVAFKDNSKYLYESKKLGRQYIQQMIRLANVGVGLNSFINTNERVRKGYTKKIK